MKKMLIAFDGVHFAQAALDFAKQMHVIDKLFIVGSFMPYTVDNERLLEDSLALPLERQYNRLVENNIERFENYCKEHGINYRVHKSNSQPASLTLRKKTRFADLLILSGDTYFDQKGHHPNQFLREILHHTECPVLLVPENCRFPSHNLLAYDGSASSAHAIKQFIYLLPEFAINETTLFYANEDAEKTIPDGVSIEELATQHFKTLHVLRTVFEPKRFLHTWLSQERGAILVSGSYGGSALYRLFHKSFISQIIKEHQSPIFIAHK